MVKVDLITGFLGSGKTTFIRKYAQYLMDAGNNIGILENDYGAVNVDMMLLQDLMGDNCELEMVSGGCDADCHRRRFKTKLIAMGMCGYDRVIVEPSGIFDVDEFFDLVEKMYIHAVEFNDNRHGGLVKPEPTSMSGFAGKYYNFAEMPDDVFEELKKNSLDKLNI